MNALVERDERERAVDAEAERLVAAIMTFGVLVLVMVRSLRGEAAWDLMALVVAAGFAGLVYRVRQRVVDRRLGVLGLAVGVVSAVVAAVVVAVLTR